MVSTKLIEKLFVSRQKEIDTYTTQTEAIQEKDHTDGSHSGEGFPETY